MDGTSPAMFAARAQIADAQGTAQLQQASEALRSAETGRALEAADQFEALLATTLVREMRKGLSDGFFGDGPGADVFEGWLDEHVGGALAESGALDLAGIIKVNLGYERSQSEQRQERQL